MTSFNFHLKTAGLHKLGNTRAYDEEFSTEMYDKTFNTENMPPYNSYSDQGIFVQASDNPIRIVYSGLLARSGAEHIYAAVGYGDNRSWEDVEYIRMEKTGDRTFELSLPVRRDGSINIAFKDCAGNWDNNSGLNYTFNNHFNQGSH